MMCCICDEIYDETDEKQAARHEHAEPQANPIDKLPGKVLTVVLRDDSPLINCQDAPAYRSVRIELTAEQRKAMALHCTGTTGGTPIYESISKCFVEPKNGD